MNNLTRGMMTTLKLRDVLCKCKGEADLASCTQRIAAENNMHAAIRSGKSMVFSRDYV
jgi:hypothetical protein